MFKPENWLFVISIALLIDVCMQPYGCQYEAACTIELTSHHMSTSLEQKLTMQMMTLTRTHARLVTTQRHSRRCELWFYFIFFLNNLMKKHTMEVLHDLQAGVLGSLPDVLTDDLKQKNIPHSCNSINCIFTISSLCKIILICIISGTHF